MNVVTLAKRRNVNDMVLKLAPSKLEYTIEHHVPGRVRVHVPALKGLSFNILQKISAISVPDAIIQLRPNPLTGSLVVMYDPTRIDVTEYLDEMASNPALISALER